MQKITAPEDVSITVHGKSIADCMDKMAHMVTESLVVRLRENKDALEKILESKTPPFKKEEK